MIANQTLEQLARDRIDAMLIASEWQVQYKDEPHCSIHNLWKQVLNYFDAFQVGLTATPGNRTCGYFNQNLICDYGYQKALQYRVLVPYNVFDIETKITKEGAKIAMGEYVGKREKTNLGNPKSIFCQPRCPRTKLKEYI